MPSSASGHQHSGARVRRRRRTLRAGGFTLIEILIATTLGSVVVTLAATVAVQSLHIQRRVETQMADVWRRERLASQFETDLRGELTWLPSEVRTLEFSANSGHLIEVLTLTPMSDAQALFDRRLPSRVVYLLEPDPNAGRLLRLIREVRFLTDVENIAYREVLAENIKKASVERFVEDEWTTEREPESKQAVRPAAVRLNLVLGKSEDERVSVSVLLRERKSEGIDR